MGAEKLPFAIEATTGGSGFELISGFGAKKLPLAEEGTTVPGDFDSPVAGGSGLDWASGSTVLGFKGEDLKSGLEFLPTREPNNLIAALGGLAGAG